MGLDTSERRSYVRMLVDQIERENAHIRESQRH